MGVHILLHSPRPALAKYEEKKNVLVVFFPL